MKLNLRYDKEETHLTYEEFWKEQGGGVFDNTNKTHVLYMIQAIAEEKKLDEYGLRRLEVTIKTELPFFAKTRVLAKNWLVREFVY